MSDGLASARLRSVMDCVPAGIAIVDSDGLVVDANSRWTAMNSTVARAGLGMEWWTLIHPDDHRLLPRVAGSAVEVRGLGAGGEPRWMSVTVSPIGAGAGAVVALTDIDGVKRDEVERTALRRIADAVTRGDDPRGVFVRVAEEVAWLVGADGAGVAQFVDSEIARLVGRWAADPALEAQAGDELPLRGDGTTARVFATGRPCRVDYTALIDPGETLPHPWKVSVAAPIHVDGRPWGALGVVSTRSDRLSDDAEERLEHFAEFVGIAISNAEARELLVHQASTDPLTGLPHHGSFHESLFDEVVRAGRYGHALSLAVIDIDHFKLVNDEHGHLVGDQTLCAMAECLRTHARAIDVVARIGGEEFAWLMPETSMAGARVAAERLRLAVSEAPLGVVARLTVSVGVAALDPGWADASDLFRRADNALYGAKAAGRDRTIVSAARPPVA